MLRFQLLKPPNQDVIFGVGDFRSVQNVVKMFVAPQLLAQLFHFPRRIFHRVRTTSFRVYCNVLCFSIVALLKKFKPLAHARGSLSRDRQGVGPRGVTHACRVTLMGVHW